MTAKPEINKKKQPLYYCHTAQIVKMLVIFLFFFYLLDACVCPHSNEKHLFVIMFQTFTSASKVDYLNIFFAKFIIFLGLPVLFP